MSVGPGSDSLDADAAAPAATPELPAAPAPATRSAFRHPVMRAIVASEAISAVGSQMTFIALPWFVLATTGSATRMGVVFAVELLPIAVLGIPSGLLVARWGVRRTLVAGDAARAGLIAVIPLLHVLGELTFPALLVVVFLGGACGAPYLSAQRLVIPEAFGDDEALVVAGNGFLEGATRLAALAGPALAGGLIALIGAVNVLWFDAASFAVSCLVLLAAVPRPAASLAGSAADSGGVLAGARFVVRSPLLARVTVASLLFGFSFPLLLATLPVLTQDRYHGHAAVAGLLFAAWGGGALIGTFVVTRLADRVAPIWLGAFAAACMAIPLWFLVMTLPAASVAAILVVSGIFTPMLNAPLITLILLRTPDALRAKVITFVMTANLVAGPVGYALAGPLLGSIGIDRVFLISAAGVSAAALTLFTLLGVDTEADSGAAETEPPAGAQLIEPGCSGRG